MAMIHLTVERNDDRYCFGFFYYTACVQCCHNGNVLVGHFGVCVTANNFPGKNINMCEVRRKAKIGQSRKRKLDRNQFIFCMCIITSK